MEFWNYSHRVSDGLRTLSPLPSHEGECCGSVFTSATEVLLSALCLHLFVSKQDQAKTTGWNLVELCSVGQGRTNQILLQI